MVYIARAIDFSQQNKGESNYTTYVLNYANTLGVNYEKAKSYLTELPENSLGRLITLGFLNLNNRHTGIAKYFATKLIRYIVAPLISIQSIHTTVLEYSMHV